MPEKSRGKNVIQKEILELLRLKEWSQMRLASELGLHESTISLWLSGERNPTGPSKILMRQWLAEARACQQKQPA